MAAAVYSAISAVAAELAPVGIAKNHFNAVDQYQYRSIDDVLNRLAPLLAKHRLCVLPRVLRRIEKEREGLGETLLLHITLKVRFELVSAEDGSMHAVVGFGEALDGGDKGTAKAMSSAYKAAMLQTFCIPVSSDDPDAASTKLRKTEATAEPVQGWEAWVRDIIDMIGVCETKQALRSVQSRQRSLLAALSRERPELYRELGETFGARSKALAEPAAKTKEVHQGQKAPTKKRRVDTTTTSIEHEPADG
jgi:hypothetical protein